MLSHQISLNCSNTFSCLIGTKCWVRHLPMAQAINKEYKGKNRFLWQPEENEHLLQHCYVLKYTRKWRPQDKLGRLIVNICWKKASYCTNWSPGPTHLGKRFAQWPLTSEERWIFSPVNTVYTPIYRSLLSLECLWTHSIQRNNISKLLYMGCFLGSKETEFPANEKSKMPFTSWCSIQIKLRCSKERTETTLAFSKLYGQTMLTCWMFCEWF